MILEEKNSKNSIKLNYLVFSNIKVLIMIVKKTFLFNKFGLRRRLDGNFRNKTLNVTSDNHQHVCRCHVPICGLRRGVKVFWCEEENRRM